MSEFHQQMFAMSSQVLRDSALENGAIIAANGIYLPPTATPYHFVWGRDASKHLLAAHALRMDDAADIRERFLEWIIRCVPGDDDSRLFIKRNHLNGPNDFLYNDDRGFQPDNNGALISAIDATRTKSDDTLADTVIRLLANGLSAKWDVDMQAFSMRQQNLWENTIIEVDDDNFFTHALLVAAHGLRCATESLDGKATRDELEKWARASDQMYGRFISASESSTINWFGKRIHVTSAQPAELDAGIVLAVPELLPKNATGRIKDMATNTVRKVGQELLSLPYGALRYEGDSYDGIERSDGSQATAGAWPLLGYAWVRAARQMGMDEEADEALLHIDAQLERMYADGTIPAYLVPEQIHPDGDSRNGKGPMHFAWGSAEWVLAHS